MNSLLAMQMVVLAVMTLGGVWFFGRVLLLIRQARRAHRRAADFLRIGSRK